MLRGSFITRVVLLTLLSGYFIPHLSAQTKPKKKKIEFSAKETKYDKKIGKGAKRLIGDVVFKHENIIMRCDSAWLFDDETLEAYKNVHIQQGDSLHLYGDVLKYNGNTKKAELQKNIRMMDKDMTLTTDLLFYDAGKKVANYTGGGKIVTKDNVLTSTYGNYFAESRELGFKKNVVLTNPEYVMHSDTLRYNTASGISYFHGPTTIRSNQNFIYCEDGYYDTYKDLSRFSKNAWIRSGAQRLSGDSLFYDRKRGVGAAKGNVAILDSAEKIRIVGQRAEYFEMTERSYVTGKPVLQQLFDKDTLYMGADTLRSEYLLKDSAGKKVPDHTHRILRGYHHVKIYKADLQGKCDSVAYTFADSVMRMYRLPVIWSDKEQITGKEIHLSMNRGSLKYMDITENAFIISSKDSIHYDQIKGRKMRGYFHDNELSLVHVEGNGQTIYFPEGDSSLIGVNRTDCSEMKIHIQSNSVKKIVFLTRPDGKLVPLKKYPSNELKLKGFVWREGERPLSPADVSK